MPEQLALEQGLGEAGALYGHQRAVAPRTGLVYCTGRQLLACSGLAQQQYGRFVRRHQVHQVHQFIERRATPHHLAGAELCAGDGHRGQQLDEIQ